MGENVRSGDSSPPELDGAGLRIGVVCGRFNDHITLRLLDGVRRGLATAAVSERDVVEVWVPGAFEIPLAAKTMATAGTVDAVVCIGAVIRGETAHFDFVAGQCAEGIQRAQLDTGVPIAFGVLTTEDLAQALARSEPAGGHNVGEEGVLVAVEMALLVNRLRKA
jgi:6,7-dimethyl-8-ribityllumazine synthase